MRTKERKESGRKIRMIRGMRRKSKMRMEETI